jgi:hypothetical protein
VKDWSEHAVSLILPAAALAAGHPRFRGGYAASAGAAGARPGRLVIWWRPHPSKPVVVGLVGVRWDAPSPGLVTVDRIRWPPGGTEARVRAGLLALGEGVPAPADPSSVIPDAP